MEHFLREWRSQFRGDAIVKDDTDLTPKDMAEANLILFGDVDSNSVMGELMPKLPAGLPKPADGQALVAIYPNPLAKNGDHYVVLNSGFTFREYDYLNNARQVPKLPDWALLDITGPVTSRASGKVVEAGFFNEAWELAK